MVNWLISLILVATSLMSPLVGAGDVPKPVLDKQTWKGSQCVEPPEDIRRNHMKYLLHHRDRTVHEGVRTQQHSLKNCIGCHVTTQAEDGSPIPVTSRQHFCNACHAYTGVTIDCFQCHATHPESGKIQTAPLQAPVSPPKIHDNWQPAGGTQ